MDYLKNARDYRKNCLIKNRRVEPIVIKREEMVGFAKSILHTPLLDSYEKIKLEVLIEMAEELNDPEILSECLRGITVLGVPHILESDQTKVQYRNDLAYC